MGVGESHALGGEGVEVGGGDAGVGVVGVNVAVAHVVGHDEDDVGLVGLLGPLGLLGE